MGIEGVIALFSILGLGGSFIAWLIYSWYKKAKHYDILDEELRKQAEIGKRLREESEAYLKPRGSVDDAIDKL